MMSNTNVTILRFSDVLGCKKTKHFLAFPFCFIHIAFTVKRKLSCRNYYFFSRIRLLLLFCKVTIIIAIRTAVEDW